MSDDLCVGVARELRTRRNKLLLQGAKILDDAVMHHRHLCRHMRMCIGLDGLAVRGPARVADAGVTEQRIGLEHSFEIAQLAFGAPTPESSILHGGDAGGVITAILEALQRVNQLLGDRTFAEDANDAAHRSLLHRIFANW
jgi:hypothetical protein